MHNFNKYLPVTTTEKSWGFYVTTVGYTKIGPRETYPPPQGHPLTHVFTWNKGRILDGYYLVFISKGKGVFESAYTPSTVIQAGTCFFLFPGVWHRYKPDSALGWEEYWVGFKGDYPDQLMKDFFSQMAPAMEIGLHEPLLALFQRLLETVQAALPGYPQVIAPITMEMLGLIYHLSTHQKQKENPDHQQIDKAMFLLRESLDKPVNMEELARDLPMGYSKFRKEFKRYTGTSPHEYQLQLRINKAKDLLQTTTLNINQIGYQTGFDSSFYFSKLFKRKTGYSPKAFRLKNQQI